MWWWLGQVPLQQPHRQAGSSWEKQFTTEDTVITEKKPGVTK
jgi:hypothetical protein